MACLSSSSVLVSLCAAASARSIQPLDCLLMKSWKFWILTAVLFGLRPFFLFLGLVSAGAGEGNYFLAKILFHNKSSH
jgi:hypothetical protein